MRIPTLVLGLVTALVLAAPAALAADSAPPPPSAGATAPHQHAQAQFPMKAGEYQHVMDERVQHAREKLEARITEKKLAPERAREVRARFDAGVVNVRRAVGEACADGQVTKAEARHVNKTARALKHAMRRH